MRSLSSQGQPLTLPDMGGLLRRWRSFRVSVARSPRRLLRWCRETLQHTMAVLGTEVRQACGLPLVASRPQFVRASSEYPVGRHPLPSLAHFYYCIVDQAMVHFTVTKAAREQHRSIRLVFSNSGNAHNAGYGQAWSVELCTFGVVKPGGKGAVTQCRQIRSGLPLIRHGAADLGG